MISGIAKGITDSLLSALKFRGDVLKIRKFIREQIFGPRLQDLHKPEVARDVASKMFAAAYGADQANLIAGLAWLLMEKTIFIQKIDLIADVIVRQAPAMQRYCRVVWDQDDITFKFVEGQSDMEDFITSLLSIIGG